MRVSFWESDRAAWQASNQPRFGALCEIFGEIETPFIFFLWTTEGEWVLFPFNIGSVL